MHVPVAIIGAGPSGSLLAWMLRRKGIESIVIEARSREYVEGRIRAGVLEQGTVDTLIAAGVGDRLKRISTSPRCVYRVQKRTLHSRF